MHEQPITPDELAAEYKRCLKRERRREWSRRQTKQGKFEASFVRYEQLFDDDEGEAAVDKLRCAGALGAVVADTDVVPESLATDKQKLDNACKKLRRHGLGHLVPTLRLIAKNVNNREETICEMMRQEGLRRMAGTSATEGNCAGSSTSCPTRGRRKRRPKRGGRSGHAKKS